MNKDIRWKQRFQNYLQAFEQLKEAVELSQKRELSKLEKQGLIQAFEYTHELSWNVLKDYLQDYGYSNLIGSKDTTRQAFKVGIITDGQLWMDMITARNLTSHTYNSVLADEILSRIVNEFYYLFKSFTDKFLQLYNEEINDDL